MSEIFITWSGWFFGFAGFLFGFWKAHIAAVDRRELAEIRRRATAPYLAPSAERFHQVYDDHEKPGETIAWSPFNRNILYVDCPEVGENMEKGDPVIFVIENRGQDCARVSVKLDGEKIFLLANSQIEGAEYFHFLKYPFDPELRGQEQTMELWFECNGIQDTHRYRIVHGKRVLVRIDPP